MSNSQFNTLDTDVSNLTDTVNKVVPAISDLRTQIDALKKSNPNIAADLAGIEQATAALEAAVTPPTPTPTPAPAANQSNIDMQPNGTV